MVTDKRLKTPRFLGEDAVLGLAHRVFECIRDGGSVLTDVDAWTDENIDILFERFVNAPDFGVDGFFDKLSMQLEGLGDGPIVLMAELLLLDILPLASLRYETKVNLIDQVLALAHREFVIPEDVDEALDVGVFRGGMAFNLRRYFHLSLLLEVTRYLRAKTPAERDHAFSDPWGWRELIETAPGTPEVSLRQSLLYLGHPEVFLPIVSPVHKAQLADALLPSRLGRNPSDDVDRDLADLDAALIDELGEYPQYYEEPLLDEWAYEEDDVEEDASSDGFDDQVDPVTYSVADIIDDACFHPAEDLEAYLDRWRDKKNLILQGPPGTGKTWLAKRMAYALIGAKDPGRIRSVQFHPGTSYEDFVRGWRPGASADGAGHLTLVDGPLIQHAERARADKDQLDYVLVIEEINRGNPAQAFGELLTLIESTKRSAADALDLAYSEDGKPFHLPENFYIIGTMNVADRSLALVDFALRRRFAFASLLPRFGDAWYEHLGDLFPKQDTDIALIQTRIASLNQVVSSEPTLGRDFQLGHSFLTPSQRPGSIRTWFSTVVDSEIRPLLHEYFNDDWERAESLADELVAGF